MHKMVLNAYTLYALNIVTNLTLPIRAVNHMQV